jgi:hypothetical protein
VGDVGDRQDVAPKVRVHECPIDAGTTAGWYGPRGCSPR